ncbi:MAG TPA: hypothetical protein V6C69_19570 [Trichormus sp.]|jgi:hypothetical protein
MDVDEFSTGRLLLPSAELSREGRAASVIPAFTDLYAYADYFNVSTLL